MSDLLFEIGCEEIPAKMLTHALAALPAQVKAKLDAARLAHGVIQVLGTPRRVAVIVQSLAERQPDLDEQVVGPPVGAAFAPDGSLTKAGEGFAAKNGVRADQIAKQEVAGKKGLYAIAQRHVAGDATRMLLPAILTALAEGIAWPKSMKWGWSEQVFVRPVQWLLALYGGEVVTLTWAGQTSGRRTGGHRFLSPGMHDVQDAGAYIPLLRANHVLVDPAERAQRVRDELARLARENHLVMRPDDALVAEVIHLGEYPVGIAGTFDPAFLEVPEEMIVTSMRTHQRYFAFEDAEGKLRNHFATLAATVVKDPRVVAEGNQKVLASRLSDARFFFGEDKKHSFDEWNATLASVVFQAKLPEGERTIGDKVRRLSSFIESRDPNNVARLGAQYCKADLASKAVGEFPELQGTMGKHYARAHGYDQAVGDVIEQHWWPKGQGAPLPTTDDAAFVAIADRMDTLVGCFATGVVPTGSADPLGLRRAALGVLAILLGRDMNLDTWNLAETAANAYTNLKWTDEARKQLADFFSTRLRGILIDERRLDAQAVDCALGVHSNPRDVAMRAALLESVPAGTRVAFKRIGNILDDARAKKYDFNIVREELFSSDVERNLWNAWRARQTTVHNSIETRQYIDAIRALAELNPELSAFFDKGGVMVIDPNAELRANRLGMLGAIWTPFMTIGDFRKLGGTQ